MKFNSYELKVIHLIRKDNEWHTTNLLADATQKAWETVDKAICSPFDKGYLLRALNKKGLYGDCIITKDMFQSPSAYHRNDEVKRAYSIE